ncbi:MAG: hypothetical protein DI556_08720 [Rhodovulum sulfidophilum]|uniref:FUSC family protein n=1 Tax=Rhodovulum sulfidophilum TaxID=35806 RepID=A0A2W5QFA9_RHOSU|nr:MAG: hypothetical protein DI556_08720 [Rhodovulum sulfidophilum]
MPPRPLFTFANVVFSLKTFTAAMLAYWIALRFGLAKPFWAVGTVYIVAHPLSGAITSKAIYRLAGTVIGGVMTVALVPNLVNSPPLLAGAIALWVGVCLYVSLLDRTPRSYVFLLAGYTVLLAGLPLVNTPELVFDTAVSRVEEIGLAIICAALVSRIVLPNHAGPVLLGRVDAWLATVGRLAAETLRGGLDGPRATGEWRRLASDAVDMRAFTTHVSYDTSHHRELTALMRGLQRRKVDMLPVLSSLADMHSALRVLDTARAGVALALFDQVAAWIESPAERSGAADPRAAVRSLGAAADGDQSWEGLLVANAAGRLRELIDIWEDCARLRADIAAERISRRSRRVISQTGGAEQHVDHGMALLSAFAAVLCVTLATVFWIRTGWSDGMTVAQISGVFCCLLATMDDPVPAMRKFLPLTAWAAVAAFVYNFALLPWIDGFPALVAALGLFLIPAGVCLAVPSMFLVGMGLCVNFPFLLMLDSRLQADFVTFLDGSIATMLALVWAMVICGLVKSVGAEASGRRLLRAGWRQVSEVATLSGRDARRIRARMLDTLGLLAPRVAAVSPDSDLAAGDLVRDLRVAINLARLRDVRARLPARWDAPIGDLLEETGRFYGALARGERPAAGPLLGRVDLCLAGLADEPASQTRDDARRTLAALRLCLAPAGASPLPAPPLPDATILSTAA